MALRRRWDPFYELLQQQDRLGRIIDEGFGNGTASIETPAIDVYEEDNRLTIEASLPNFDEKDIEINLTSGGLEIKAAHTSERENKRRRYLLHELRSSSFYRYINLPAGARTDQAKASFNDGILRIEVPMDEQAPVRRLELAHDNSDKDRQEPS